MSEDPKLFNAGDYNLFRYCHNDPIDMTDPMGTQDQNYAGLAPREISRRLADEQYGKTWPRFNGQTRKPISRVAPSPQGWPVMHMRRCSSPWQ
ncbi:MAG: hypothetical protein DMF00_06975 [Verrucomicrobia bacterium]|nr:MAG: hypothetical protein DMF00_06975 [Verrucomicrobiota bacterium]